MNKENGKMPKWKDMVVYEKVFLVLGIIIAVADLGISIYYKFSISEVSSLLLAVILLLSGGVCIRTKKRQAYLWFGLSIWIGVFAIAGFII